MGAVRTEDGVELVCGVGELGEGLGGLPEVLVVGEEVDGALVLEHLDRRRVERGDAALGGRELQLGAGLHEDIVGVGELRLRAGRVSSQCWDLFHNAVLVISVEEDLTRYYSSHLLAKVRDCCVYDRILSIPCYKYISRLGHTRRDRNM